MTSNYIDLKELRETLNVKGVEIAPSPFGKKDNLHSMVNDLHKLLENEDFNKVAEIAEKIRIISKPERDYICINAFDLQTPPFDDPNELIKHRFLCRGAGMILYAETGIGKSVWAMQAGIIWTLGLPFCGIKPARPMKCLLIQAEDDQGDCAEMRDGVRQYLKTVLKIDEHKIDDALKNFPMYQIDDISGKDFASKLEDLIGKHHADLVIINPLFSYVGGKLEQDKVTDFLRNSINPILHKTKCGCLMIHHTPKPKNDFKNGSNVVDSYGMFGSSDFSNWQRAGLCIKKTPDKGIFKLIAVKRGHRLRWLNSQTGDLEFEKIIGYAKERDLIYWRDAESEEIAKSKLSKGSKKAMPDSEKVNNPEMIEKALFLLDNPKPTTTYRVELQESLEISQQKARALFEVLISSGKIKKTQRNKKGGPEMISKVSHEN